MKKLFALILVLLTAASASAQITIPNTFSPNTTAQSALVNANFSQLGALALNRAGGNLTGNLTADGGVTIDGIDIGATICITCDPTFDDLTIDTLTAVSATLSTTLTVTGAVTFSSTLEVNSTASNAVDIAGGLTAGSGNVGIVGTDGRIPALSSTYLASLSGANLTSIPESAIADGAILARYAEQAVFTGTNLQWATAAGQVIAGFITGSNGVRLQVRPAAGQDGYLSWTENTLGDRWALGIEDGSSTLHLRQGDTSGTDITTWTSSGFMTHAGGIATNAKISPGALSSGNNNNYAPTGHADTVLFRLTGNASGSTLTGLQGGVDGRRIILCATNTNTITLSDEDTNSTDVNRFADLTGISFILGRGTGSIPCVDVIYDGTASRWLIIGRGI